MGSPRIDENGVVGVVPIGHLLVGWAAGNYYVATVSV